MKFSTYAAYLTLGIVAVSSSVLADDNRNADILLRTLKEKLPATTIDKVESLAVMPGLFEVTAGRNVFYTNSEGRYFIFGHVYDTEQRVDITANSVEKLPAAAKLRFSDLPLDNSIKATRGDGRRHIAVFADPNCGYCKMFERELQKLDNITVHTFLTPLLSESSRALSETVWCSKNRSAAWSALMLKGQQPSSTAKCDASRTLNSNLALATRLGVHGTPTYVLEDGTMGSGAATAVVIESQLAK